MLAIATAFAIGLLGGRESERRDQTPASYRQTAKANAQSSCVGSDPLILFECVYDKVESSAEQAHDEQDLSAQQRAATSALVAAIASLFGLGVSIVGIYYIRRTIRQGQEGLEHARRVSQAELRPYIYVADISMERKPKDALYVICVRLRNYGRTPAIHVNASINAWVEEYPVPEHALDWGADRPILVDGVCAPDQERRVFTGVRIERGEPARISRGELGIVLQVSWIYESEFGDIYEEFADHISFGPEWRKGPFYLLSQKHFAVSEDDNQYEYDNLLVETEGEAQPKLL